MKTSKMKNNRIVCTVFIILIVGLFSFRKFLATSEDDDLEHRVPSVGLDSVEKRLVESNANWLRSLEYRKKLEGQYPLDPRDQWSYRGGIAFWDFFYPSFDCPFTSTRIGRSGDGGKWICGFHYIKKRSKRHSCVVYSYGVSEEWSFDKEILDHSKCSVYMYDHTIDIKSVSLAKEYPKRAFIESVGLGVGDNEYTANKTRSLKTQMKRNGHTFIDIVKVDTDNGEFDVIQSWNAEFPDGPPFGQLVVDIYLPTDPAPNLYAKLQPWMEALEKMGLRPFRYEINVGAIHNSKRHTPNCWQYSFINVKLDHYLLHEEK